MDEQVKQRLVGTAVLVALAVVFIPMFIDESALDDDVNLPIAMPVPPPETFGSDVIPIPAEIEQLVDIVESKPMAEVAADPDESVAVEAAEPEAKAAATVSGEPPSAMAPGVSAWVVQIGSFGSRDNAEALREKLRSASFSAFVEEASRDGKATHRVRVGPEFERDDAEQLRQAIETKMGLDGILVEYP